MSVKETLLSQMKWSYDDPQKEWFANLSDVLDDLSFDQAILTTDNNPHTIWEILNHLIYWNDRNLQKFKDPKVILPEPIQDNEQTFKQDDQAKTKENWINVVEKAHQVFSHWITVVEETSEDRLTGPLSESDPRITWDVLAHMNVHNAYHIGQIVFIRKLLGIWENKY